MIFFVRVFSCAVGGHVGKMFLFMCIYSKKVFKHPDRNDNRRLACHWPSRHFQRICCSLDLVLRGLFANLSLISMRILLYFTVIVICTYTSKNNIY